MNPFELLAALTTVTALFAYVNYRWVRLPTTIGLMAMALVSSLLLLVLSRAGIVDLAPLLRFIEAVDFDATLLNGVLGALLFAGALHVDLAALRAQRVMIAVLAVASTFASTIIVGGGTWGLTALLGTPVPLAWCLVFGALISPTDPIAVGAILKGAGVPPRLRVMITGESLFNDGIGVVAFLVLLGIATGGESVEWGHVAQLFAVEVLGGLLYGAALGWLAVRLLARVDDYQVEILLTLAITTGGYVFANRLHLSGALAMVVAGLVLGSSGRAIAMSARTQARLDDFWELVDEFLNAMLFVLIGIEAVIVEFSGRAGLLGLLAIALVLLARWASVAVPLATLPQGRAMPNGALSILTWAGLRGGISVALALSLPSSPHRSLLVTMTYVVVCFSILVQGLTVQRVVQRAMPHVASDAAAGDAAAGDAAAGGVLHEGPRAEVETQLPSAG